MDKVIPGTQRAFEKKDVFEEYRKMIGLTDGLALSQVCSITGLDPSVIQNWVKRGYVSRPIKKKYHEKQFARILMVNALKGAMRIEDIGKLMVLVNGDVEDESDDLMSEADLYNLFANVIYHLDEDDVDQCIRKEMKTVNMNDDKLFTALEVMVNAYIASEFKRQASISLKKLETY